VSFEPTTTDNNQNGELTFGGTDSTADGVAALAEAINALDPRFKRPYEYGARAVTVAAVLAAASRSRGRAGRGPGCQERHPAGSSRCTIWPVSRGKSVITAVKNP